MNFCFPGISGVFQTNIPYVNTAVIENQKLFCSLISDIALQIEGFNGTAVLSDGDRILNFAKNAELLTAFVPFELNKKSLINKIASALERESVNPDNYNETMQLMAEIEKYLDVLAESFDCNLAFSKVTPSSVIKSAGIEIVDDYDSIAEKVIDYMELVREFDCNKLFITVNMRSYIDDHDAELFMKTCIDHEYSLLMIENTEYKRLPFEKRITIDSDLCEF